LTTDSVNDRRHAIVANSIRDLATAIVSITATAVYIAWDRLDQTAGSLVWGTLNDWRRLWHGHRLPLFVDTRGARSRSNSGLDVVIKIVEIDGINGLPLET
jgi:hypothetical protein